MMPAWKLRLWRNLAALSGGMLMWNIMMHWR